ncbi:MAG: hypothetical protein NZO16_00550 [Deltaproteobacteria bacterium]|nr:hypothetical protein [Deltaproteobacteria bacterium]
MRFQALLFQIMLIAEEDCFERAKSLSDFFTKDTFIASKKFESECVEWVEEKELENDSGVQPFYIGRFVKSSEEKQRKTNQTVLPVSSMEVKDNQAGTQNKLVFEPDYVKIATQGVTFYEIKLVENSYHVSGNGRILLKDNIYFSPAFSRPIRKFEVKNSSDGFSIKIVPDATNLDVELIDEFLWIKASE